MLKGRPESKWLNPLSLVQNILDPVHRVARVNYYTARISPRQDDLDAPARQATYLNALRTVPQVSIHEGSFLTSQPWMPLVKPPQGRPDGYHWSLPAPDVVKVLKSEEKGSDVNLAVHLVRDALTHAFDVAVVVTNDSDLVEPIRIATREAGKRLGLLVPVKYPNRSLMDAASFYLRIRPGHLTRSQFPNPVVDAAGKAIVKPATWA